MQIRHPAKDSDVKAGHRTSVVATYRLPPSPGQRWIQDCVEEAIVRRVGPASLDSDNR
jgi:hypothetical protein